MIFAVLAYVRWFKATLVNSPYHDLTASFMASSLRVLWQLVPENTARKRGLVWGNCGVLKFPLLNLHVPFSVQCAVGVPFLFRTPNSVQLSLTLSVDTQPSVTFMVWVPLSITLIVGGSGVPLSFTLLKRKLLSLTWLKRSGATFIGQVRFTKLAEKRGPTYTAVYVPDLA